MNGAFMFVYDPEDAMISTHITCAICGKPIRDIEKAALVGPTFLYGKELEVEEAHFVHISPPECIKGYEKLLASGEIATSGQQTWGAFEIWDALSEAIRNSLTESRPDVLIRVEETFCNLTGYVAELRNKKEAG